MQRFFGFSLSHFFLLHHQFARSDASFEEVQAACRLANATQFIEALPDGYNTTVGPRGASLSGGQRQRISIARALLHSPDLLLLDEPTSSLDYKNEALVRDGLRSAMQGRTCVIVAHRLSTIKFVDKIAVIKRGVVVDVGTHDDLMQSSRFYKRLYAHELRKD